MHVVWIAIQDRNLLAFKSIRSAVTIFDKARVHPKQYAVVIHIPPGGKQLPNPGLTSHHHIRNNFRLIKSQIVTY